jgi:hypothetical protein
VDFEDEKRIPRSGSLTAIGTALEKAGVVFEDNGKYVDVKLKIRRRNFS